MTTTGVRKKLIEVALPLAAINKAAAREKSIRHGHPSTLHLWWARRPLAAARAVIFAQMVDDPFGVRRRAALGPGDEARRATGAEEAPDSSRIGRGGAASDPEMGTSGQGRSRALRMEAELRAPDAG